MCRMAPSLPAESICWRFRGVSKQRASSATASTVRPMPISLKSSHASAMRQVGLHPIAKSLPQAQFQGGPRADCGAADFQTRCRPDANTEQHEKEESNET